MSATMFKNTWLYEKNWLYEKTNENLEKIHKYLAPHL